MGSNLLELHGVSATSDSLFESVCLQLQVLSSSEIAKWDLSDPRLTVSQLFRSRGRAGDLALSTTILSKEQVGDFEVVGVLSEWLCMTIEIFLENGNRRTYPSSAAGRPTLRVYRYERAGFPYYDSIIRTSACTCPPHVVQGVPIVSHELRLGVWNLSGAANMEKRLIIDEIVSQQQIDIVCIQESHLYAQSIETSHYHWVLGPQTSNRASRGCGFLISKRLRFRYSFKSYSVNICHLEVAFSSDAPPFYIICVHKHSEGAARSALETGQLTSIIRELRAKGEIILVGDFNAHLGQDLYNAEQRVVGKILCHSVSNTNGHSIFDMCEQLELRALTTIHHYSTRFTWYRPNGKSQIDHVFKPESSLYKIGSLRGRWTRYSDHKLITFILRMTLPRE